MEASAEGGWREPDRRKRGARAATMVEVHDLRLAAHERRHLCDRQDEVLAQEGALDPLDARLVVRSRIERWAPGKEQKLVERQRRIVDLRKPAQEAGMGSGARDVRSGVDAQPDVGAEIGEQGDDSLTGEGRYVARDGEIERTQRFLGSAFWRWLIRLVGQAAGKQPGERTRIRQGVGDEEAPVEGAIDAPSYAGQIERGHVSRELQQQAGSGVEGRPDTQGQVDLLSSNGAGQLVWLGMRDEAYAVKEGTPLPVRGEGGEADASLGNDMNGYKRSSARALGAGDRGSGRGERGERTRIVIGEAELDVKWVDGRKPGNIRSASRAKRGTTPQARSQVRGGGRRSPQETAQGLDDVACPHESLVVEAGLGDELEDPVRPYGLPLARESRLELSVRNGDERRVYQLLDDGVTETGWLSWCEGRRDIGQADDEIAAETRPKRCHEQAGSERRDEKAQKTRSQGGESQGLSSQRRSRTPPSTRIAATRLIAAP
jgi:hypothetical protein